MEKCWVLQARFLSVVAMLVLLCGLASAQETAGSIDVELTKMDNGFSLITIALLGTVILLVIIISLAVLARRRSPSIKPVRKDRSSITVSDEPRPRAKTEFYETIEHKREPEVVDEKAEPIALTNENPNSTDIDKHLKEDERIVINVLRMKHDSCTQATIRVVTDFSKARLSRILAELEQRGIIYKEQQGRKNLITLRV